MHLELIEIGLNRVRQNKQTKNPLHEDFQFVTSVQAKSDPVDDETDEDEEINNESRKGPTNQSAILLNYCCSRESETLQRKK
ncbi:hypothetical protein TNCV_4297951 [Trichonephila clavipes]|nr:hypothetical protein TNCV_4297951 [Trichonephila clavipes]